MDIAVFQVAIAQLIGAILYHSIKICQDRCDPTSTYPKDSLVLLRVEFECEAGEIVDIS